MYPVEYVKVSEASLHTYNLSSTMIPNVSSLANDEEHFCKAILYKEIRDSRVRIWDVAILIPNLLFLLFIAVRFNRARLKLRATSSPIFLAFYGLVICNVVISVVRCVVSMTVNAAATVGGKADKVLWVTVRFFLLSTEMSVVIFGLAFGHLDSRSSIRRVLLATSLIALAFTITQGTLELVLPDDTFHIPSRDFYVFGHGGMMFWFCSSLVFTMIYLFILILPWTRLRDRLTLPTRKSFYIYAGTLAMLDLVQSIGAGFLNYTQNPVGLCVVDFTTAVYLTLFTPLVYHTFLSEFFGISQPSIMFSYKAQVDDAMDEDTVSLPHQQSFSSLKTDSDYIYQVHTPSIHMPLYDSESSKSFAARERSSFLHSSPRQDWKSSNSSHAYTSRVSIYRSVPRIRSFAKRLNLDRTFDHPNYPLTKSDNFLDIQQNASDLKFFHSAWKTRSRREFEPARSSSVSDELFLTPDPVSSLFSPVFDDPGVNPFSTTRESSFAQATEEEEIDATRVHDVSPLRSTLHSILDSDVHALSFEKDPLLVDSVDGGRASPESRSSKDAPDTSSRETEGQFDIAIEDAASISSSASLAKSSRWREEPCQPDSGGLSDYLLSLTVARLRGSNSSARDDDPKNLSASTPADTSRKIESL